MDNIVEKIIRSGSKRQVFACICLTIANMSVPFEHVMVNFLTPYLDFWCDIEDISHCPVDFQKSLINMTDHNVGNINKCFVSEMNWTRFNSCDADEFFMKNNSTAIASKQECSTGFKFDLMGRQSTVTSKFNLVCDKLWILEMITPIYLTAMVLGSLLSGLADIFGRKKSLMGFHALHIIGGSIAAFSNNVYLFIFGRLMIAVALRGIGISTLILIIEIFPSKKIQLGCWMYVLSYSLGPVCVALLAYLIRYYEWLQLAVSLPFGFIFLCYFIPESPSWLISKNKIKDATTVLKTLAKSGGYLDEAELELSKSALFDEKKIISEKSLTFLDLFKHRRLSFYCLALTTIMSTVYLTNLGMTFNMGLIFGDIYINIAACSGIEIISLSFFGIFILKIKRRKYILIVLFLLFACLVLSLIFSFFEELTTVLTITTLGAKSLCPIIMLIVNIYTGELFPTQIRQQASGFCNGIAAIVTISAPILFGKLKLVWVPAPFIIFSSMTAMSFLVACFLPETKGRPLPQNLQDITEFSGSKAENVPEKL